MRTEPSLACCHVDDALCELIDQDLVVDAHGGVCYPPQISPTVNPLGNGSSGSTTYCAKPVIQACPESAGTTAAYGPTRVSSSRRPVKTVPRMPSCTKSWPIGRAPLACSTAIFAQVPVPHGERSTAPV